MFRRAFRPGSASALALLVGVLVGCQTETGSLRKAPSPVRSGLGTNDLVDVRGQIDADELGGNEAAYARAESLKQKPTPEQAARRRSVLCLSGGGSYGAYSAGVLVGWTASGDRPGTNGRPNFDVVTGISTGALIAPLAFLGPEYDPQIQRFYTTIEKKDVYTLRPVRGLFSLALADNGPLAELVEKVLTPDIVCRIAAEHRKGRRLYIGTTELESKRFVFWDIGEIANRGTAGDRLLIKKVLLGSSAIPGFFPPSKIPVTVDGKTYVEEHGDGGTTVSIFFRPPFVPPEQRTKQGPDLVGVDLYMIVAGKLFADATPLKQRSLTIAASSVSSVIYAQTRGDLQRMYLMALVTGMNYHLAAIPGDFPAPTSSTAFERGPMTEMFNEGYRLAAAKEAWRSTPPCLGPGESLLGRYGTDLTYQRRGPGLVFINDQPTTFPPGLAPGLMPVPALPGRTDK
ncbi:patatin-like phospholipase family protein [Gemmata sp. JC717]|uniref:patatin-like phospholipase family protein n=1 Tax=Gemmata algarum TaxID=2975278 RepID=UPI0021BB0A2E|nr:patatin-like phospholipase family protein [Gemmata algarum]MDY3555106.1 patatin-like phospholipase family protein [Gemmata algarum]